MKKPVIAIDGYSSTGKSSISKVIAKKLGLLHLDTGALYRGITYYALIFCKNPDGSIDWEQLFKDFSKIHLDFQKVGEELLLNLNGKDISVEIRTQEISDLVSIVAKQPEVRNFLLNTQRNIAQKGGVIMDGRDIGTVVLPNADIKFFMTASIVERTKRRFHELQTMGIEAQVEEVMQNLITRDKIDSEREIAPLKQAEDAILIDNSRMDKKQTIDLMLSYIQKLGY
ncbi:MAG: (d)CMP kinase [Bacteroidetes bacterium]|nr:(d)CMP kinase [Bacteroidota bacterium]